MDSIYPDAIDGYSQLPLIVDGVTTIDASNINAIRSAIVNIENELGIVPSGSHSNVKTRLDDIDIIIASLGDFMLPVVGGATNKVVKLADAMGNTLTSTNLTIDASNNLITPGNISAVDITSSGDVSAANITSYGNVTTVDITSSGNITSSGDVTATRVIVSSLLTVGGDITAVGMVASNQVNITDTLTVGGVTTLNGDTYTQKIVANGDIVAMTLLKAANTFQAIGSSTFSGLATFNNQVQFNQNVNANFDDSESFSISGGVTSLQNRRYYGSKASPPTNPPLPAPNNGDTYFDTLLNAMMYWDAPKGSWLSEQTMTMNFGRNGTVPIGGYFRAIDGKAMSNTIGEYLLYDAKIIAIALTRDAPLAGPWVVKYGVVADGNPVAEYSLSGVDTKGSVFVAGDTNAGQVLAVRVDPLSTNESTGGTVGTVFYKWRK